MAACVGSVLIFPGTVVNRDFGVHGVSVDEESVTRVLEGDYRGGSAMCSLHFVNGMSTLYINEQAVRAANADMDARAGGFVHGHQRPPGSLVYSKGQTMTLTAREGQQRAIVEFALPEDEDSVRGTLQRGRSRRFLYSCRRLVASYSNSSTSTEAGMKAWGNWIEEMIQSSGDRDLCSRLRFARRCHAGEYRRAHARAGSGHIGRVN